MSNWWEDDAAAPGSQPEKASGPPESSSTGEAWRNAAAPGAQEPWRGASPPHSPDVAPPPHAGHRTSPPSRGSRRGRVVAAVGAVALVAAGAAAFVVLRSDDAPTDPLVAVEGLRLDFCDGAELLPAADGTFILQVIDGFPATAYTDPPTGDSVLAERFREFRTEYLRVVQRSLEYQGDYIPTIVASAHCTAAESVVGQDGLNVARIDASDGDDTALAEIVGGRLLLFDEGELVAVDDFDISLDPDNFEISDRLEGLIAAAERGDPVRLDRTGAVESAPEAAPQATDTAQPTAPVATLANPSTAEPERAEPARDDGGIPPQALLDRCQGRPAVQIADIDDLTLLFTAPRASAVARSSEPVSDATSQQLEAELTQLRRGFDRLRGDGITVDDLRVPMLLSAAGCPEPSSIADEVLDFRVSALSADYFDDGEPPSRVVVIEGGQVRAFADLDVGLAATDPDVVSDAVRAVIRDAGFGS